MHFKNQKALVRVDFNVPLDKEHQITDDTRIQAALPTIKKLLENNNAVILASHLGRPMKKLKDDGSVDKEKFSLKHLVDHLSTSLDTTVHFATDTIGEDAQQKAEYLKPGEVLLLENTRFNDGEKKGDPAFAKKLSLLADVYVNDAFGTAHRAHGSTATVAQYFEKGEKSFGLLMENEIKNASKVLNGATKPFTAIIGGAKVSDKILLIDELIKKVDHLVIGGGMAYTFLKAKGGKIGNSLFEEDKVDLAKELLKQAAEKGVQIHLPEDSIIADKFDKEANFKTADSMDIEDGWMGLDIGTKARIAFANIIENSKTILWNGPMGVFEMDNFSGGTKAMAHAVAYATQNGAFSLIGGGDSVAAINQSGLNKMVSYVSTGGGAMLEFLEGKELPGIAAINR